MRDLNSHQGDQMSLKKSRPKYCPAHYFAPKLLHNLNQRVAQNVGYLGNFQKTPKVNNHPMAEKSPNPVTLNFELLEQQISISSEAWVKGRRIFEPR
jgi:hypothetical protein